jgi:hypothetical protein
MTLLQIEKRVKALEKRVQSLARAKRPFDRKWYRFQAGRFAGDPVFDEILELGRAHRRSQRPKVDSKPS